MSLCPQTLYVVRIKMRKWTECAGIPWHTRCITLYLSPCLYTIDALLYNIRHFPVALLHYITYRTKWEIEDSLQGIYPYTLDVLHCLYVTLPLHTTLCMWRCPYTLHVTQNEMRRWTECARHVPLYTRCITLYTSLCPYILYITRHETRKRTDCARHIPLSTGCITLCMSRCPSTLYVTRHETRKWTQCARHMPSDPRCVTLHTLHPPFTLVLLLYTAPDTSWRRSLDSCTPLLFDVYHWSEHNGCFVTLHTSHCPCTLVALLYRYAMSLCPHNRCLTIHASQYMPHNTCLAIHASQYIHSFITYCILYVFAEFELSESILEFIIPGHHLIHHQLPIPNSCWSNPSRSKWHRMFFLFPKFV